MTATPDDAAPDPQQIIAELQRKLDESCAELAARTRELQEALVHQNGSANILKVIASSPTNVAPVLQAIAESACELCEAVAASVFLKDGNHFTFSGHHGPLQIPGDGMPINRGWVAGRAFLDQIPVHVHDMRSDDGEFPEGRQLAERFGHRTTLGIPLLRDNTSIGAVVVRRMEVRPFTIKQIELIRTFADQAVIAIRTSSCSTRCRRVPKICGNRFNSRQRPPMC
jgi:transcriptional regulator with GAF, ATPase, and Fis domain